jgi:hypothetical protein
VSDISIREKLEYNVHDLDAADFEIDMAGTTISSFSYSYGSIEDLELDEDAYVSAVDGASTSDFVYLPKEIYDEVIQDLEELNDGKSLLRVVRNFIDRLLGDHDD